MLVSVPDDARRSERMAPPVTPTEPAERARGEALSRTVWLAWLATAVSVLATAAVLAPDAAGHGTHTQLGLPPCGFLLATGWPCPGCGLTTSFAHMVRLEVVGATAANPFGVMLFLVTVASVPIALLGAARALPVVRTLDRLGFERGMIGLAVGALVVWGARMAALLL